MAAIDGVICFIVGIDCRTFGDRVDLLVGLFGMVVDTGVEALGDWESFCGMFGDAIAGAQLWVGGLSGAIGGIGRI